MAKWLQYYIGGGYAQMITILHRGGSLGTPKSDYVICARPLILTQNRDQSEQAQRSHPGYRRSSTWHPVQLPGGHAGQGGPQSWSQLNIITRWYWSRCAQVWAQFCAIKPSKGIRVGQFLQPILCLKQGTYKFLGEQCQSYFLWFQGEWLFSPKASRITQPRNGRSGGKLWKCVLEKKSSQDNCFLLLIFL